MKLSQSYDELKAELKKRGCQKGQIESKVVPIVFSILSDRPEIMEFEDIADVIAKAKERVWELERRERELLMLTKDISKFRAEHREFKTLEDYAKYLEHRFAEISEYVLKYYGSLEECESAEGRDAVKRAQLFVNSVNINTKYDNTAFIIGLASILNCGNALPIDTLKKINTKLQSFDEFKSEKFMRVF